MRSGGGDRKTPDEATAHGGLTGWAMVRLISQARVLIKNRRPLVDRVRTHAVDEVG